MPLRAVSEALDCNVDWDGDTKTVAIAPHKYNEYYTQKLMENLPKDENYVISPFSLEMAMMMASEGLVGDTKTRNKRKHLIHRIQAYTAK